MRRGGFAEENLQLFCGAGFKKPVEEIVPLGSVVHVKVPVGGNALLAELPVDAPDGMNPQAGQQAHAIIKLRRPRYFEAVYDRMG